MPRVKEVLDQLRMDDIGQNIGPTPKQETSCMHTDFSRIELKSI